jgi:spore coat polysaccharide biosynthesis protein SpsF
MGSTRLPGKVLKDICGDSMLARVVSRTKQAQKITAVVVATSDRILDEAIVSECKRLGVPFFRGSEDDVLDRYYQTALRFKADIVVRITSDCPLIDPTIIDLVVNAFLDKSPDYASNALVKAYPRGLDVEVLTLSALTRAWIEAKKPYQRVHVTPYIYENPDFFKLLTVGAYSDLSDYRWTVDTPEDLEFVRGIYAHLGCKSNFSWHDILELCNKEPSLVKLNCHIQQKPLEKG